MKLFVNGEAAELPDSRLDMILTALGHEEKDVATALNGNFVPRSLRAKTTLSDGDRLEILAPMQGG